jgi:uncharacterized YigZ family protein
MVYSYLTLQSPIQGIYKEKGSKFLAFGYPVTSDNEIKSHLQKLRKEYHDARHLCYAWVLGPDKERFRAVDGGEPHHSAGDPILGQLRFYDITNVLVVVVRYFGGIKLGVAGLAGAYRAAAKDALQHATVLEKDVKEDLTLRFRYEATPEVMKLVKAHGLEIAEQEFANENLLMRISVCLRHKEALLQNINILRSRMVPLEISGGSQDS